MKKFDIVVFGSTGFTGRLVCKHIAEVYHGTGQFTWAMAGRSKTKMEQVRSGLVPDSAKLADVELLEANVSDQASMDALAASASVIITTVGPYASYGRPLVEACVKNGAHYCDLTGEAQYMRRTMDEFDAAAKANGVRIVHSCGFDSVPSDVVTLMAAHHMATTHGMKLGEVASTVAMKGGGSGGTIESGITAFKEVLADPEVAKIMEHPYSLTPQYKDEAALKELRNKGSPMRPMWSKPLQCWTGPFIMAEHNEKIVNMSNALLGWKYGKDMKYTERDGRGLVKSVVNSVVLSLIGAVFFAAVKIPWIRKKLPMPGEGPSEEVMHGGSFKIKLAALPQQPEEGAAGTSNGSDAGSEIRVFASMADMKRDPGYWSTSRMLLECAICMIPKHEKLLKADPYANICSSGVLSPSAAFGLVLHDRLKDAGYELFVGDSEKKSQ